MPEPPAAEGPGPAPAPRRAAPEEVVRTLTVDGLRYAYRRLPHPAPLTDPVLVLGGARQGMYGWTRIEELLGPVTEVITADLPGMGRADALRPGDDNLLLCRAVERLMDELGPAPLGIFGYSHGASLAFTCAQRRPERVARLLLGGVPYGTTEAERAYWVATVDELAAGRPEEFATRVAEGMLCTDPARHVHRRRLAYNYVRRLHLYEVARRPDAAAELYRSLRRALPLDGGLTGVPTLVFCGEHDNLTPPHRQRAFAATIAGSAFTTLADSDHWVVLERGDAVAELAYEFFAGAAGTPAGEAVPLPEPRQKEIAGPRVGRH
ncbi:MULTISPECIES: alpha/beta fold hydrolase [Streptomyces]|uniref:Alpha/beta hydrolase fold protein n=1 Tax=Streptomyces albus (strain ATCC 21838 / DSM 41398 / FERM P-419 / JCM 4703 / NBRC 107858) TaxID=1081613 RepID=A0A0B5EMM7_STRA4|nr:alpha/beta hydrolase [Streptomyces sp. SCSIO ZS0520]AJE83743.1 alpha/beta hydrolase fold protein [Streptomyces albus]AOU78049.1 alpha/beta hydrolase fold protein [Streptomyces albus]